MAEDKPTYKYKTPCMECGVIVQTNSEKLKRCKPCLPEYYRKLARQRHWARWTPRKLKEYLCQTCGDEFQSHTHNAKWCPSCRKDEHRRLDREYRRNNPTQNRQFHLRQRYGMSLDEYYKRVVDQQGKCAICEKDTESLCVDHDHDTGEVRGLLCGRCNTSLGGLGDNLEGVLRAALYLSGADPLQQEAGSNESHG